MSFRLADASTGPIAAEVPSQPISSTPTSIAGVTLQLYVVRRVPPGAVLVVFALQTSAAAASVGLEGSIAQAVSTNDDNSTENTVSGVSLFDPAGLKEYETYMVNPSNDSTCLCTTLSGAPFDQAGTNYEAALVAAPPSGVTSVSFVTGLGTIANVALGG
ncbi:MAG TPA: hypothetical protein VIJ20_00815 [Solirubrobacteraceae bacterium]